MGYSSRRSYVNSAGCTVKLQSQITISKLMYVFQMEKLMTNQIMKALIISDKIPGHLINQLGL